MQNIYLYTSSDKIPKEVISEIDTLKDEALVKDTIPLANISVSVDPVKNKLEIRFDVSNLDYEPKHETDIKIRKILKKHKIKFLFSNPGHTKVNFYYASN